jgi:hypothetical protein
MIEHFTSFAGMKCVATGSLAEMLSATKTHLDSGGDPVLIFDDRTGRQTDFDFRGTIEEVLARAQPEPARPGPGRPRLGVVSAEVSLLPRHWDWLNQQPARASGTLRRLVEEAMKRGGAARKAGIEAIAAFMWSIAGNLKDFEESTRALYAQDWPRFNHLVAEWPTDVRVHLEFLIARLPAVNGDDIVQE